MTRLNDSDNSSSVPAGPHHLRPQELRDVAVHPFPHGVPDSVSHFPLTLASTQWMTTSPRTCRDYAQRAQTLWVSEFSPTFGPTTACHTGPPEAPDRAAGPRSVPNRSEFSVKNFLSRGQRVLAERGRASLERGLVRRVLAENYSGGNLSKHPNAGLKGVYLPGSRQVPEARELAPSAPPRGVKGTLKIFPGKFGPKTSEFLCDFCSKKTERAVGNLCRPRYSETP